MGDGGPSQSRGNRQGQWQTGGKACQEPAEQAGPNLRGKAYRTDFAHHFRKAFCLALYVQAVVHKSGIGPRNECGANAGYQLGHKNRFESLAQYVHRQRQHIDDSGRHQGPPGSDVVCDRSRGGFQQNHHETVNGFDQEDLGQRHPAFHPEHHNDGLPEGEPDQKGINMEFSDVCHGIREVASVPPASPAIGLAVGHGEPSRERRMLWPCRKATSHPAAHPSGLQSCNPLGMKRSTAGKLGGHGGVNCIAWSKGHIIAAQAETCEMNPARGCLMSVPDSRAWGRQWPQAPSTVEFPT